MSKPQIDPRVREFHETIDGLTMDGLRELLRVSYPHNVTPIDTRQTTIINVLKLEFPDVDSEVLKNFVQHPEQYS